MNVSNIAIWDLETGGLNKEKSAVCEIAIIILCSETLTELDRYETIVAPYKLADDSDPEYNPRALEVNGLTMTRIINEGKPAKQVVAEVAAFLKKHKKNIRGNAGKCIPAGHNIDEFDIPFFINFLAIFKVDFYELFQRSSLDTMTWVRLKYPIDGSILNHKLATACKQAGIDLFDAHRAMNDVEANTRLVIEYIKSLRGDGSSDSSQAQADSVRKSFKF